MTALDRDIHILKHVMRRGEQWTEVLRVAVPEDDIARSLVARVQNVREVCDAVEQAARLVGRAQAKELVAALLLRDDVAPLRQLLSSVDPEFAGDVNAAMMVDGMEEQLTGSEIPANKRALFWIASVPGLEGSSAAKECIRKLVRERLYWGALQGLARFQELPEGEAISALANAVDRLRSKLTSGGLDLPRAVEFIRCALVPAELEANVSQRLEALESEAPGLRAAYDEATARAISEAGLEPRHCTYDRLGCEGNECYIDQQGVTCCLSQKEGETYRLRTSYRPVQGRGSREKRLEAIDAAVFSRLRQASNAVADFEAMMGRETQRARIHDRYTEESWCQIR